MRSVSSLITIQPWGVNDPVQAQTRPELLGVQARKLSTIPFNLRWRATCCWVSPHSPRVQPFKELKGPWVREGIMLSSADSVLLAPCQMTVYQFPRISLNRFYNLDDARHLRLVWGLKASVEMLNKWTTCSRKERKQRGRGRNGKKISVFACYKCWFDDFTEHI